MAVTLVISGCCGRMGSRIASLALEDSVFAIGAALEANRHARQEQDFGEVLGRRPLGVRVGTDARMALSRGDVVIEFTSPEVTMEHLRIAQELKKPMVIGTTGLSEAQVNEIRTAAKAIPIVLSPNMSLGVNVLFELARTAAQRLGEAYDVEVVEAHHRQKKDAPSGTAKRLASVLASARQQSAEQIPVHAVRAGDIVGDHTVVLAGPSERVELTHRAQSRDVFAKGALRAAQFVVGRSPGLYDMSDVLKAGRT